MERAGTEREDAETSTEPKDLTAVEVDTGGNSKRTERPNKPGGHPHGPRFT